MAAHDNGLRAAGSDDSHRSCISGDKKTGDLPCKPACFLSVVVCDGRTGIIYLFEL
jgi:hypothetical protein